MPVIGITINRIPHPSQGHPMMALLEAYVRAVADAGGSPVLIPLGLTEDQLDAIVSRLDGILFSGGGDVDPQRFQAEDHPRVGDVDADRDRVEIHLARSADQAGLPYLGICRGIQLINVALGGTLYTHIADQHPDALKHDYFPNFPRDQLAHPVRVEPGSRLERILGAEELPVNSLHHQGVRQLANNLRPLAYSPDGLIEAVENPRHPFGLAVQWHPEWLQTQAPMRSLFQAFVQAATS